MIIKPRSDFSRTHWTKHGTNWVHRARLNKERYVLHAVVGTCDDVGAGRVLQAEGDGPRGYCFGLSPPPLLSTLISRELVTSLGQQRKTKTTCVSLARGILFPFIASFIMAYGATMAPESPDIEVGARHGGSVSGSFMCATLESWLDAQNFDRGRVMPCLGLLASACRQT